MKDFHRDHPQFSQCGLNCLLCPMQLGGYCPGCGGGEGNQSCAVARCGLDHGGVEYCFQCGEFPCARYEREDAYDSFITHRNRLVDLERAQRDGIEAYQAEQRERCELLGVLLERCNDGRRKTLFSLAANLLELEDLREIMERLAWEASGLPIKERAGRAAALCKEAAARRGVELRLRKPPGKSGK